MFVPLTVTELQLKQSRIDLTFVKFLKTPDIGKMEQSSGFLVDLDPRTGVFFRAEARWQNRFLLAFARWRADVRDSPDDYVHLPRYGRTIASGWVSFPAGSCSRR